MSGKEKKITNIAKSFLSIANFDYSKIIYVFLRSQKNIQSKLKATLLWSNHGCGWDVDIMRSDKQIKVDFDLLSKAHQT